MAMVVPAGLIPLGGGFLTADTVDVMDRECLAHYLGGAAACVAPRCSVYAHLRQQ
jgi:hypothetical protein